MFCRNCGQVIADNADVCIHCGVKVENKQNANKSIEKKNNANAIVGFIFSFFVPLVGIICSIIGLIKSKECNSGKGLAIAGIVISVIIWIISLTLYSYIMEILYEYLEYYMLFLM
ncbi:MAG: hypothetical protein IKC35_04010 [Clostridia bacterium]|nr:hypothetical protein [Clostridia bacterium]